MSKEPLIPLTGSSTSSLTSSTSIDSSSSSILGGLDNYNSEDFSLDSLFMDPQQDPNQQQQQHHQQQQNNNNNHIQSTMKSHHNPAAPEIVADSTFSEMVPFVDWSQPMDWPHHPGFEGQSGASNLTPGSNCLLHPGVNQQNLQTQDMRVLGVDLDMLTSTDPFYTSPTPPPSPDSSSATGCGGQNIGVSFKGNSMAFEVNKVTRQHGGVGPHHMACHDYTNKVWFHCIILDSRSRAYLR